MLKRALMRVVELLKGKHKCDYVADWDTLKVIEFVPGGYSALWEFTICCKCGNTQQIREWGLI